MPFGSSAQQRRCMHNASFTAPAIENGKVIEVRQHITIPVAVHVISEFPLEVSDLQVHAQVNALNRDFRRRHKEWEMLPEYAKHLAADTQIEFELALADANGNPTVGINRRTTTRRNIGLYDDVFYSQRGGIDAWDTHRYLNVWVAEMPDGLLGYASSPEDAGGATDGVVINIDYFGTSRAKPPYQLGRTLVHEVGHYLGLSHLWGKTQMECDEGDGLEDTPVLRAPHYECPPIESESCEADFFYWNFMDYTPDCCMALFTQQQALFMLTVLEHYRPALRANIQDDANKSEQNPVLSPNPAESTVLLSWTKAGIKSIKLYTASGQLVGVLTPSKQDRHVNLCLGPYPKGILFFTFCYEDGTSTVSKLIHR